MVFGLKRSVSTTCEKYVPFVARPSLTSQASLSKLVLLIPYFIYPSCLVALLHTTVKPTSVKFEIRTVPAPLSKPETISAETKSVQGISRFTEYGPVYVFVGISPSPLSVGGVTSSSSCGSSSTTSGSLGGVTTVLPILALSGKNDINSSISSISKDIV
ncbi:MAG: hypothetical protein UR32_C0005G0007 [candidate division WS6 bacterium GW2011_GWE2_33_157]|nr:MAG: hypothetical protein UR32_C0005G0007 [candidate division WS6 bacterium GW2011_GWE2_33_157]